MRYSENIYFLRTLIFDTDYFLVHLSSAAQTALLDLWCSATTLKQQKVPFCCHNNSELLSYGLHIISISFGALLNLIPTMHLGTISSPRKRCHLSTWCESKWDSSDQVTYFHCFMVGMMLTCPLYAFLVVHRDQLEHWNAATQPYTQQPAVFWHLSNMGSFQIFSSLCCSSSSDWADKIGYPSTSMTL